MKKILLLSTILLSVYLTSAQKTEPVIAGFEGREIWGEEANKVWQGAEHIWLKEENKIPAFVQFRAGSEPDETSFFIIVKKLYHLPSAYTFQVIRDEKDDIGWQHKRFQLLVNNVPVSDAIFILHMVNGKVKKYNGELFKNVTLSSTAYMGEKEALNYALNDINAQIYKWQIPVEEEHIKQLTGDPNATNYPKGKLEIVQVDESNVFKLVWKFDIYAHQPLSRNNVFVDAQNGIILKKNPLLYNVNTTGTAVTVYRGSRTIVGDSYNSQYRLYETTRGKGIHTWNLRTSTTFGTAVEFLDADNVWNNVNVAKDQYAGDAHWGGEMTYDFYKSMGRNSVDNAGYALNLYVHYSSGYVNAFWDGREMTFGDGDGTYAPLVSLDITGHEISHGLDQNTADLTYLNESGALNESFSDIFGTAVEWFADSTKGNWTIGEDIGAAFRDMSNPSKASEKDPDTYKGTYWYTGTDDNGGVHTNSNVQNFWYYLLAQGGTGTNDINNAYNVGAIGRHKATQIAWRNMVYYLTSSSKYADSRMYAIQSAIDLFGNCSPEVGSTTRAWYAVGVGANYTNGSQAQFTGSPLTACTAPTVVTFTNTSSNGSSYIWYFGDNTTSTATNPVHTYSALGTYTVKLVVSGGACGNDSLTKANYVSINSNNACALTLPGLGTYQTQTACNGTIYDNGGPTANYTDLTNSSITISPTGASKVKLHFTQFKMETNYDYLYVYDGPSTSSPIIASITGTTIPADITSTGSSITIRQSSDNFVNDVGFTIQWACIAPSGLPAANFMSDVSQNCSGNIQFTDLTTGGASSWLWNFGDGTTSTLQSPLHQYLLNGVYTISLKATNSFGSNTATKTNYITIAKPTAPVATNVSACGSGSSTLSSTSTNHIAWLDSSGAVVSSLNPYVIPNLTNTTTYWVQDSVPQPVYDLGPADNTMSDTGLYFNNPNSAFLALRFKVMKKCKLLSVYVYANGAGYRTIQYRDTAGGVIAQKTVNCPNGGSRITLNIDLIPGGPYELGIKDTMNLYRNQGNAHWPYTDAGGMVSITGNNTYKLTTGSSAPYNYYYFYDWNVQGEDCISERRPVTATVGGSAISVAMTPINPTCFGSANGSASVAITGGSPQYKYNWSNGQTTANATNVPSGTLTVTVTDASGCSSTASKTLTQPTAISPAAAATNVTCNGGNNGAINLTVTGGTPNYTYNWGGNITSQNRSALIAGTYTVTITDGVSCTTTSTKTITQPSAIVPSAVITNVTCFGLTNGNIDLSASGGTPGYTYNWGTTPPTKNGFVAGTYKITITDAANCTATAQAIVSQPTAIVPTLASTNVTCHGDNNGSITTSVTGGIPGYTYNWGNNITTQNRNGISGGTYTVVVTDATNCTVTASKTISEPPAISLALTKTDAKCSSFIGSATATVSGGNNGYKYLWNNNKTTASINNLPAGNYALTVSDASNCSATAAVVVNDSFALTTIPSSINASCYGLPDGMAQVNVSTGTPPYTYHWTNGDTTLAATDLAAGNYFVTVTDSNQCHGIASIEITQPVKINFDLSVNQPSCNSTALGTARVHIPGNQQGFSIKWSTHIDIDSITNLAPGVYSVSITDASQCEVDSSFTITDAPAISVGYTTQNVSCFGAHNGSVVIHSSGGSAPYTYLWTGATGTDTLKNLSAGNYTVTVTNNEDCSATASISVSQPAQFSIGTSATDSHTGQSNGTASVNTLTGGTPPYTFNWSTGDTAQTVTGLAPGSYVVTATDKNGCQQVGTAVVKLATGIASIDENISFTVYPNPATTEVVVEVTGAAKETLLSIKSMLGQSLITRIVTTNKTVLDLSTIAAGIYLVELQSGEHKATKQLVVTRP